MKTLIITTTYNELENLRPLLEGIFSYAPDTDVLIVDDYSPDGTGELADEIGRENPQVKVLHRPGKLDLGTAYTAGFKYAIEHGYDAAFEMDADFSHDPRYLPDFLQAIEHADLVIGSCYVLWGRYAHLADSTAADQWQHFCAAHTEYSCTRLHCQLPFIPVPGLRKHRSGYSAVAGLCILDRNGL